MYTIHFLVNIFSDGLAKKIFLASTVLCATNSIIYLVYSLQTNTMIDMVISSMMIAFSLLLFFYYIAYIAYKPKPVVKIRKGLRYITEAEQWVNKKKRNKNFEKELEKELQNDPRFGQEFVYKQGHKISRQQLRRRFNEKRESKLRQQRTLDKKIDDLVKLGEIKDIPERQQRDKQLQNTLLADPTFVQQVVTVVKDKNRMSEDASNKEVLQAIVQEKKPLLKQETEKMLTLFGEPIRRPQQVEKQFFDKLSTNLSTIKSELVKKNERLNQEKFTDSFLNEIKNTDSYRWFKNKVKTQKTTDKDLLHSYIHDTMNLLKERDRRFAKSNRLKSRRPRR